MWKRFACDASWSQSIGCSFLNAAAFSSCDSFPSVASSRSLIAVSHARRSAALSNLNHEAPAAE